MVGIGETPSGRYRIGKRYTFAAAHHLSGLPPGHKCTRVHGHSYTVEVVVVADELSGPGFVTDFGDLTPLGSYIADRLDHQDLNQVLAVEPTSERLARHLADWFRRHVEPAIAGRLELVRVSESASTWAEYWVGSA